MNEQKGTFKHWDKQSRVHTLRQTSERGQVMQTPWHKSKRVHKNTLANTETHKLKGTYKDWERDNILLCFFHSILTRNFECRPLVILVEPFWVDIHCWWLVKNASLVSCYLLCRLLFFLSLKSAKIKFSVSSFIEICLFTGGNGEVKYL